MRINIPQEKKQDIIDAFCSAKHYEEEVPNPDYDPKNEESPKVITNPQSKASFAKEQLLK